MLRTEGGRNSVESFEENETMFRREMKRVRKEENVKQVYTKNVDKQVKNADWEECSGERWKQSYEALLKEDRNAVLTEGLGMRLRFFVKPD